MNLDTAIIKNNLKRIKILLEKHQYDEIDLFYAIRIAANNNKFEILKYLIDVNNIESSDLDILLNPKQDLKIMKYLIENGADIHYNDDIVLIQSAQLGYYEKVKYLISKGANIHAQNNFALIESARKGHIDVVKYLIEKGADINAKNNESLKWSIDSKNIEMIKYLLQEGANIKVLSEENQIKYKQYGYTKLVLFLLDFHFKRETEFSKNKLADCNILKIVFSY